MKKIGGIGLLLFVGSIANAQERLTEKSSVNPRIGSAGFSNLVFAGQTSAADSGNVILNISHQCFGTNLRNVSNPVSPLSDIVLNLNVIDNGTPKIISLKYPATVLLDAGPTVQVLNNGGYTNLVVQSLANTIRLTVPADILASTDTKGNMVIGNNFNIDSFKFSQEIDPNANAQFAIRCPKCHVNGDPSNYLAKPGNLSGTTKVSVSRDRKSWDIKADIPGQVGFCNGFYSPLMVFFDEARPQFTAEVEFPLSPMSKSYWPEKGSKGAFIAYDQNKDGKITTADELFGNSAGIENGFEALRVFDTNKDNVIDKKDKEFTKLLLWYDDGNGVSTKKELKPLHKSIQSISLVYDGSTVYAVGERAEARQFGTFTYMQKGKVQTGKVVDYWFAPVKNSFLADSRH